MFLLIYMFGPINVYQILNKLELLRQQFWKAL